ncbi:hypothetical protein [Microcystis sp. BLCC-F210]|uniref:hypothetical protein n=1 Tax=Microcystis sp. BLCC-F210 TaxID=3342751 RepID=UPI0035C8997E
MNYEVGSGKWEVGSGKWGSCLITLSPQNPITPKPYHPITYLLTPNPDCQIGVSSGTTGELN